MVSIAERFHFGVVLLFICFGISYQIACKDEGDEDVDWYVNYKIPKIEKEPQDYNLRQGKAYAFITAPGSESWKLSENSITSGSMLENTMKGLYSNKQELTYLFYNDDPPSGTASSSKGHLKGLLAFDANTGYWLVHSMPKFAKADSFEYPNNAFVNGQSILCVTFRTNQLNEISNQLLYSHPNIYAYGITDEVNALLDDKAKTLFTDKPEFVKEEPFKSTAHLKSLANKTFVSFAKGNKFINDLYSGIVSPGLKASLLTETWRLGSGTALPPSCESDYSVLDIKSINMTASQGGSSKDIFFKSTEDHSKWAISEDGGEDWVCIADMNRMRSQENRGGGALCFTSAPVRRAYKSAISETDQCPARETNK